MRPRHKAAENLTVLGTDTPEDIASMRPRHKAAENPAEPGDDVARRDCFNEAAA